MQLTRGNQVLPTRIDSERSQYLITNYHMHMSTVHASGRDDPSTSVRASSGSPGLSGLGCTTMHVTFTANSSSCIASYTCVCGSVFDQTGFPLAFIWGPRATAGTSSATTTGTRGQPTSARTSHRASGAEVPVWPQDTGAEATGHGKRHLQATYTAVALASCRPPRP